MQATLVDAHRVRLANDSEYTARHILVATGARPFVPPFPGSELAITSDDIFGLEQQPERLVIVGGGYIACEFAGIMNGLGTRVTLLYRGDQILRGFDEDVRDRAAQAMRSRGITIEIQREVVAIERADGRLRVRVDNGETHPADQVLLATGRNPNSAGLGLEALGVGIGPRGEVEVDEWSQTAVPSIYAVGDVTGRPELTPLAIRDAQSFAETVFAGRPTPVDHRLIPTAVFTQPEIAVVGATEAEARARGPVQVHESVFRPMANTISGRDEKMMMKLVSDTESGRVLGVHIVGSGAAEMIQLASVAMGMGATKADFDRTLAIHPTAAEELVTMSAPPRIVA